MSIATEGDLTNSLIGQSKRDFVEYCEATSELARVLRTHGVRDSIEYSDAFNRVARSVSRVCCTHNVANLIGTDLSQDFFSNFLNDYTPNDIPNGMSMIQSDLKGDFKTPQKIGVRQLADNNVNCSMV